MGERIATPAQVDRICRIGAAFRMGPFELMDLVGLDVNFAVAQSFAELSFGEPRWRPTALQSRMVASGKLGRKTGCGWYTYGDRPHRPEDPPIPRPTGGSGRALAILGGGTLAVHLRALAREAGFVVHETVVSTALATVFADADLDTGIEIASAPTPIVSCAYRSLAARGLGGIVGFNVANVVGHGRLAELTRTRATPTADVQRTTDLFTSLGMHVEWVADAPGLVLGRILAQVVNKPPSPAVRASRQPLTSTQASFSASTIHAAPWAGDVTSAGAMCFAPLMESGTSVERSAIGPARPVRRQRRGTVRQRWGVIPRSTAPPD